MTLGRGFGSVAAIVLLGLLDPGRAGEAAPKRAQAEESTHWSYRPVQRPKVPEVRERTWLHNPIDAFVLAALDKKGIRPAPDTDRRTLLRRCRRPRRGPSAQSGRSSRRLMAS